MSRSGRNIAGGPGGSTRAGNGRFRAVLRVRSVRCFKTPTAPAWPEARRGLPISPIKARIIGLFPISPVFDQIQNTPV